MRILTTIAAITLLSLTGAGFAQDVTNSDYSANKVVPMSGHPAMSNHSMVNRSYGQRQHALGSMRHPTVGNTANQRVNGG